MSKKPIPTPNLIAETFIATIKILLIIVALNNILWAIFFFKPSASPHIGDTHMEITQNGNHDIKQNIES